MIPSLPSVLTGQFFRVTSMNFFFFASVNAYVLLPLHIQQIGGSEAQIGLVMGMYSAAGIFCQPLVGVWVDRVGRRPFLLLGVSLAAASSVGFNLFASLPILGALRSLQGIGFSAFFVANYTMVVDLVPPERRGWALGIFGISGLLSTALSPLAGEFVIRHFGFHAFFAMTTLLALVALALAFRVRESGGVMALPLRGAQAIREGLGEILRLHMALAFFFGLGTGTIFTFLPTFGELLGVTSLALFYTAYAGAAVVVRAVGGGLSDTLGRRAVIVPSMFVQAIATGILAVLGVLIGPRATIPLLPFLFLSGLLAGGAHGFLYPALAALLIDETAAARRGSVVGIFSSVFLAGIALGSMMFGYVIHGLGYGVMWSVLTVLLAAGFLASFRLRSG
ncbi:MAG: MFS transporter [Candidatus Rokubacteria bacterium]|nr:MFS transporter [Candidatus Rokubacteria bacterium]